MLRSTRVARRSRLAAAMLAAVVAGTACGQPAPTGAPATPSAPAPAAAPSPHNNQDVMFAHMMISHHQQAIAMSETELAQGASPQVKQLATAIKDAQDSEIHTMRGWLEGWHAPAKPSATMNHDDGMMSPQQMAEFQQTRGAALDRMFLQMMISHHEGAVAMARAEQQQGQDLQAQRLADSIVQGQQAQITQMQQMLG